MVPGPKTIQTVLESTMTKIDDDTYMIELYKKQLNKLRRREEHGLIDGIEAEREAVTASLKAAEASFKTLDKLHKDVTALSTAGELRIIGHVAYSPPITIVDRPKLYSQDWALIEFDNDKLNWAAFRGNAIDLGTFL